MKTMRYLCFCSLSLLTLPAHAAHTYGQQKPFLSTTTESGGELYKFDLTQTKADILGLAEEHGLDVWHLTPSQAHIYVPFSAQNGLRGLPDVLQAIPHDISSIPLTRTLVDPPPIGEWNLSSLENTTYHDAYHPLHEVNLFIHQLAESFPDKVHVVELGHSALGREMFALKLSTVAPEDDEGDEKKPKPPKRDRPGKERELDPNKKLGFVVVGAQHAREWVAKSASMYLAHALAVDSSEHWSLTHLLDVFDFYIIPSPNPDGYSFTWEEDRFWYKNRQLLGPREECVGLDMNRNWGYKWKPFSVGEKHFQSNASASSSSELRKKHKKPKHSPADPCSFWYPGRRPFQSPEVNNIANWVGTLPNLVGLIELRAYGQMLSTPFSYSCNRWPFDLEDQTEAGEGAVTSLRNAHGTVFEIGSLCSNLYTAPGNMIDWMYKRLGIKYSYVAHLRDTGTYGFALPAQFIRPVGEETGAMIEYLSKFIRVQMKRVL